MKQVREVMNKLMERKLAWGVAVMALVQIQGYMPSLDFLSYETARYAAFAISVILTIAKGVEMFYEQNLKLVRDGEIQPGDTDPVAFVKPTETQKP